MISLALYHGLNIMYFLYFKMIVHVPNFGKIKVRWSLTK